MFSLKLTAKIPSHILRNLIYCHLFQLTIGLKSTLYGGCEIRSPEKISVGDHTIIGNDCLLDGRSGLIICNNVNISSGVWIWTLHHDIYSPHFSTTGAKVIIHDRAWLCSRSTILPGVTIGEGAVVASNATVTKDVLPFNIVAGVPAKKIGERPKNLNYILKKGLPFI
ncbi:Transferase hexapeptide repeat [Candidatus Electrothrix laxa]